ncbi:MAG: carbohydrate-binding protein [Verrucomicrobiaceae bacterium]|nr:carbohydrate-binding protein [Verrucomicrobiaceae bacterium]
MKNFLPFLSRAWFVITLAAFSLGPATAEDSAPGQQQVSVSSIVLATNQNQQGTTASATVTILDRSGAPIIGARVTGFWSGLTSAQGSALTNQKGRATFHSTRTKDKGTFVFDLGTVSAMGATYDAGLNAKSHDSINSIGITEVSDVATSAK